MDAPTTAAASPPPLSPPARARRQQKLDHLTAAALRALAGNPALGFRAPHAWRGGEPMAWMPPHLHGGEEDGLLTYRAIADSLALRERLGDREAHALHAPDPACGAVLARMLYEWFEHLRVEALAPETLPGSAHNLRRHFEDWSRRYHDSPLIETRLGLLLFSVSVSVWSRLSRTAPEEQLQDTMESTRAGLAELLGGPLYAMSRHLNEPARFAPASAALANAVAALATEAAGERNAKEGRRAGSWSSSFYLWFDPSPKDDDALPLAPAGAQRLLPADADRYRVFTPQFDQERVASELVRAAVLDENLHKLEDSLRHWQPPVRRLARELALTLQRPERDGWLFDQEAGRIDGRQLPRIVTSPHETRLFKIEAEQAKVDAALTLLIDCSGSMKAHAEQVALFAMVLGRMAELAQVPFEVLGFTTSSWNGGKARALWQKKRAGADPGMTPGRVADRLHLVLQPAGMRARRARRELAALLKADLYKEGLDGEAIEWACERLHREGAARRVLLVMSDGCPTETATHQLNAPNYLEHHLRDVVAQQERGGVDIIGIGIALDLSPFYPVNLPVEPDALLKTRTLATLMRLMRQGARRR
ncbi:MAG: cobaltochelatase CobT-related protein [Comamonas sp.]